jgi:hypothetical protein
MTEADIELADDGVDPRLVFLERAAAKLVLIEACVQDLDSAFNDLVPAFREIAVPPCQCEREILQHIEAEHRRMREQSLRRWRHRQ